MCHVLYVVQGSFVTQTTLTLRAGPTINASPWAPSGPKKSRDCAPVRRNAACLGSQQRFVSRFAIALSSIKMQFKNRIFYVWTMFRFQRGCYRIRLQFARPARLSYKLVSYRPPQLSRQHHLDIYKLIACSKLPKVISCTSTNFGISHLSGNRCHGRWFRRLRYANWTKISVRYNCNRHRSMCHAQEVDRREALLGFRHTRLPTLGNDLYALHVHPSK